MQREAVQSTNIRSLGYEPDTQIMEAEFHSSGVYRFPNVTPEEYKSLREANSIGGHFVKHFKDKPFEKLP